MCLCISYVIVAQGVLIGFQAFNLIIFKMSSSCSMIARIRGCLAGLSTVSSSRAWVARGATLGIAASPEPEALEVAGASPGAIGFFAINHKRLVLVILMSMLTRLGHSLTMCSRYGRIFPWTHLSRNCGTTCPCHEIFKTACQG